MKLPKKIIKKYGISKKAWSVFKRSKGVRMVKRRRRSRIKVYTRRRRSAGLMKGKLTSIVLPAIIYGAVREKISNALTPITSKIPFGDIADEITLGAIGWFLSKRSGLIGSIGKTALVIESARIGEAMIDGSLFGSKTTKTTGSIF